MAIVECFVWKCVPPPPHVKDKNEILLRRDVKQNCYNLNIGLMNLYSSKYR